MANEMDNTAKFMELMDDAEDEVLRLIRTHKSKMIINMRVETNDNGTPQTITVTLDKATKQGTDPVTTAEERAAARKQINRQLRWLSQGLYLDVSNMTPMGEGIKVIDYDSVINGRLQGDFCFGTSEYPFYSDNYTNYVRALVSLCGKDFTRVYGSKLAEIRENHPDW